MALPLPKIIPDTGAGGGIVTSLAGQNALANAMHLRGINAVKEEYAPTTVQAEAASKLAYARLMAPQFIAKAMNNPQFMANLSPQQKNELKNLVFGAGTTNPGQVTNAVGDIPQHSGSGQPHTNAFSRGVKNAFNTIFGGGEQTGNPIVPQSQGYDNSSNPNVSAQGPGVIENGGNPFVGIHGNRNQSSINALNQDESMNGNPMQMTMTQGQRPAVQDQNAPEEWYANTGKALGTIEQGKEDAKFRSKALNDISKAQLALSNQGAALTNMTKIIKSDTWQNMRNTIPAFQDKQLGLLKVTGTDAEKKMIGKYTAAAESLIASTVQGMGSRHLVREYDLAQRQKINDSDTTQSAEGKLQNAIELHDIAEQKNNIIADLLRNGVDEARAVQTANKMVDVSAIEKRTEALLEDKITDDDIATTMKSRNMTRGQVIQRLKSEGRHYG